MRRLLVICLVAAAAVGTGAWVLVQRSYEVDVLLASATNVVEGGSVVVNGFTAGTVSKIAVQDGKARLTLSLDRDHAPLHDGAVVRVEWKALLGERLVQVQDGPEANAVIPDGGTLRGTMPTPMEFDQVLDALDPPTRQHLTSLVNSLNGTVKGNEQDLNKTLRTAGPALQALGEVLRGLGTDGPAIKQMITQLDGVVTTLAQRDSEVANVVDQLSKTTSATAEQRDRLREALQKLPGTLRNANKTLGDVPGVVDKTVPLLEDLKPATEQLPSVAKNLRPVLQDLRPLAAELRPTLDAAQTLLNHTPALLDSLHAVLPGLNSLVGDLTPALGYLRPYTPEAAGVLANLGSASANYDSNGHYTRIFIQAGLANANVNPGVVPPGFSRTPDPYPGEAGNQPWTDAFGSGMR